MVVAGGKGIVVRSERDMASDKVCELAAATRVVVKRVATITTAAGAVERAEIRWNGGGAGWCSLRLLDAAPAPVGSFKQFLARSRAAPAPPEEEPPPRAAAEAPTEPEPPRAAAEAPSSDDDSDGDDGRKELPPHDVPLLTRVRLRRAELEFCVAVRHG